MSVQFEKRNLIQEGIETKVALNCHYDADFELSDFSLNYGLSKAFELSATISLVLFCENKSTGLNVWAKIDFETPVQNNPVAIKGTNFKCENISSNENDELFHEFVDVLRNSYLTITFIKE